MKPEHLRSTQRSEPASSERNPANPPSIHHAQGREQAPHVRPRLAPRRRRSRHPGPLAGGLSGRDDDGGSRDRRARFSIDFTASRDQPEDFVAEEKDLVSDVAIWVMYHRWCKHFKIERDHEDMIRRFANFKECVFRVHQVNRAGLSYQLAITERADAPWPKKYAKGYISSMEQLPSDVACARFKAGAFSMDSGPSAED
ncbi:unnamed protein product [Urochloa humidicola]